MKALLLTLTLLLTVLLLTSLPACAQWSTDPHQNTVVAYMALYPKMISDGDGGAIIAWWIYEYHELRVQRLDRYGYARWGAEGVHIHGDGDFEHNEYDLCEDGSGGCIVAFLDAHDISYPVYRNEVYVQRIDSLGTFLWGEEGHRISSSAPSAFAYYPLITSNGLGGYFITWGEATHGGSDVTMHAQCIDDMGNNSWTANGIQIGGNTFASHVPWSDLILSLPGHSLAFWSETSGDIWGQRIDINGNLCWGPEGIPFTVHLNFTNNFVCDSSGGCITAGLEDMSHSPYYAQRFDSLATPQWGDSGICFSNPSQYNSGAPMMTRNESGTYVAWSDNHLTSSQCYLQKFSDDGSLLWGPLGYSITANDSGASIEPYMTLIGSSELIVSYFNFNSTEHVERAQKLDSSGGSAWENGSVIISYTYDSPNDMNIINDKAGGAIMCWTVYPSILYAQQLSANGNLGEVLAVQPDKSRPNPTEITLLNCFPNPFNEGAMITLNIPTHNPNQPYQIDIYDTAGRIVRRLEAGSLPVGVNYLPWDGRNEQNSSVPSGVYFLNVHGAGKSNPTFIVKVK